MFGPMTVTPVVHIGVDADLQVAIITLLRAADQPEIVRWIEFPGLVLLFLFESGDPESGAVYVLDRQKGTWYVLDFEDDQFGGYSVSQFDQLLRECRFLDLLECPGLWQADLRWSVEPGKPPEARLTGV
jgi:hypothetical protein